MSAHPLDAVTVCADCHAELPRDEHGHLRYRSHMRRQASGIPVSVKLCASCSARVRAWEDAYRQREDRP